MGRRKHGGHRRPLRAAPAVDAPPALGQATAETATAEVPVGEAMLTDTKDEANELIEDVKALAIDVPPVLLGARFHRASYTADREHETLLALSVKATEPPVADDDAAAHARPGLDLVVLLDTSRSMAADGWLAACSAALRYMLANRLDGRDRVCLRLFDADTTHTVNHAFVHTNAEGKQHLESTLGAVAAASGAPSCIGFCEAMQQAIKRLQRLHDDPPRQRSTVAAAPCLLILTDSRRPCRTDALAFLRAMADEAALVPRLALTAIGLGTHHDANVLHALVDICSDSSSGGGLGSCYYHAVSKAEDAVAAVAEGLGQWLAGVAARNMTLTLYADVHTATNDDSDEEEEEEAAWSCAQFQAVMGAFDRAVIKSRRLLRFNLGALACGSERHVLLKLRLPASSAAAAAGEMAEENVAHIVLRYHDVGMLREQTLQVVTARSRPSSSPHTTDEAPPLDASGPKEKQQQDEEAGEEDPAVWYERERLYAVDLLGRIREWADGSPSSKIANGHLYLKGQLRRWKQRHQQLEREEGDRWAINEGRSQQQQQRQHKDQDPLGRMLKWRAALDAHAVLLDDLNACIPALAKPSGSDGPSDCGLAILTAVWYAHSTRTGGVVRAEHGSAYGGGSAQATALRQAALHFFAGTTPAAAATVTRTSSGGVDEQPPKIDALDGSSTMVTAAMEENKADNDVLDESRSVGSEGINTGPPVCRQNHHKYHRRRRRGGQNAEGKQED